MGAIKTMSNFGMQSWKLIVERLLVNTLANWSINSGNVFDLEILTKHTLTNEVELDLIVLGPSVKN